MSEEIKAGMTLRSKQSPLTTCKLLAVYGEDGWGDFGQWRSTISLDCWEPVPPEPLPCPWCGAKAALGMSAVRCGDNACFAVGPVDDSNAKKWNAVSSIVQQHRNQQ